MFLYIFCSIVCGIGGPWPEASSVWGALEWKSLGTPGLDDVSVVSRNKGGVHVHCNSHRLNLVSLSMLAHALIQWRIYTVSWEAAADMQVCGSAKRAPSRTPSWELDLWTHATDLPTCTHFLHLARILTLKYACTHCCSPGLHFVCVNGVNGLKSFRPIRALLFNTLAHLPLTAKCSTHLIQWKGKIKTLSLPDGVVNHSSKSPFIDVVCVLQTAGYP